MALFAIRPAKTKYLRKISIKQDKEGKSRPFAIFDYISQMALTSLHDSLFEILKKLPEDSTFNQNEGFKAILHGDYTYYACFDLTAATDRFPLSLQNKVLGFLLNDAAKADA